VCKKLATDFTDYTDLDAKNQDGGTGLWERMFTEICVICGKFFSLGMVLSAPPGEEGRHP
jgi:hypothetical protein